MEPQDNNSFFNNEDKNTIQKLTPVIRFWRYIQSEKKDIWNIYVYALIVGLISLSLPLGIQAVIQMISGGILYDTAILIIILVLLGVAATGALQVMQIYMVEILQRRLFAKASHEFAYRLPKIKADELAHSYPPEIVNRFFDVVVLQKGISKMLIDLTAAVLQVFFGLLLLASYHPSFIVFDILFITAAYIVFRFTGKKGLETSIKESSYKYKMVAWLQEIARNLNTFKLSGGHSNLALEKTDAYTVKYLTSRRAHFRVLVTQYINIIIFKIAIIAATLILGSLLVVDRQINLGQFVATEIVIVLILGAIEKLIVSVDTVYDSFTAVEKIAKISDYTFEQNGNIVPADYEIPNQGLAITLKNVGYKSYNGSAVLEDINIEIPAGETIAIAGKAEHGIDALLNIISGIYQNYSGIVDANGISLKNVEVNNYRRLVAHSLITDGLFEGSIFENITLCHPTIQEIDVVRVLTKMGIYDEISLLPNGLLTKIAPGGIGLTNELSQKINICRNLLKLPKLWIVHEQLYPQVIYAISLFKGEIVKPTIVVITNAPQILNKIPRIYLFDNNKIVANGSFTEIEKNQLYKNITPFYSHA